MIARLALLVLLMGLCPCVVAADEFRSPAGFHVVFPGTDRKQMTVEERTPPGNWLTIKVQEEEQGTYAASWFDLPRPIIPETLDAMLKKTQAEAVSGRGYKLLSESRHNLNDGTPGFELVLERKQDSQKMRLRTWYYQSRVFQVMVTGQKAWVDSEEATKFLDSFGLNK
jgi:hypothetical protein